MNRKTIIKYLISSTFLIAIIAFFLPRWVRHTDTKMQQASFYIHYLEDKLNRFRQDHGNFPRSEQGLEILAKIKDSNGQPYLNKVQTDPWGNDYHYLSPGKRNQEGYDLWTYGSDNKPGGNENHSKDITNWD